jgi:hypothetical protein
MKAQYVWFIVSKRTGKISFDGQSQICAIPAYESKEDAELELEEFDDEDRARMVVKKARITFEGE